VGAVNKLVKRWLFLAAALVVSSLVLFFLQRYSTYLLGYKDGINYAIGEFQKHLDKHHNR
jgi:hypothetical protein